MNSTKIDFENIKLNEGLAEFYGAMIGDGCLSRYFASYDKREIFCLLLTGHTHDEPYYRKTLQPILLKEFGLKGCIRFKSKDNVVRFETNCKGIFYFFEIKGFPVGLNYNLKIPDEILHSGALSIACIRGIFDTDGSIYRRYSKKYKNHARLYDYQVIQFKLNSQEVIKQVKFILNRLCIKTTKISIDKKSFVLRITNQKEVHKFMQLIKPSNNYHTERYLKNLKFSSNAGS